MISLLGKKRKLPTSCYLPCLLLASMLLIFLPSCKKEYFELDRLKDDVVWNPEAAVPLINSELNVADLLDRFDDEDIIVVDQTSGLLALRYFSEIFSLTAEDILVLQNQNATLPFPITAADIATLTTGSAASNSASFNYALDLSNLTPVPELYSVSLDGGNFNITATSNVGYDADVTLSIPSLTLNGNAYSRTFTVPANGTVNQSDVLSNYMMDLTTGTQGFNELGVAITVAWQPGGAATPLDVIDFGISINSLDFGLIRGDLKQQNINTGRDSVRFRIFESSDAGDLTWTDPSFTAVFTNSFGADVSIDMQTFEVENDLQILPVTGPFDVPVIINSNPTIGGSEVTSVTMSSGNSNVVTVVDIEPDRLVYDVAAITNPSGLPTTNWVADTSRIKLEMEAVLPFEGTASGYSILDTTEVDIFPLNDDIEEIVSITLRLAIDNGFPVDGFAQVLFLDSNDVVLDSLFSNAQQQVMATGEVVNTIIDQVNGRTQSITDIVLDRETLERLEAQGFRKMLTRGWIETTDMGQTTVSIFENYTMQLFLGMNIELRAKIDL